MTFKIIWTESGKRIDSVVVDWPGLPRVGDHIKWSEELSLIKWWQRDLVVTQVNWLPDQPVKCEVVVRENV